MRTPFSLFIPLFLLPVNGVVGHAVARAEFNDELRTGSSTGIYARYHVTVPFIGKANDQTTKLQDELCKLQGKSMIVRGDSSKEGELVVEKYFSRDYQAVYTKGMIRKQLGVCEHQIVPYSRILLRHALADGFSRGFTLYEYNDAGKSVPQWTRRVANLDVLSVKDLVDMGALGEGLSKVKPVEKRKYASRTCEMYATTGLETCILELDASKYPVSHLMLYQKVDREGGETTAEVVELLQTIKHDVFFPPKDASIKSSGSPNKDKGKRTNATEKWCAAQQQKTGINPCTRNQE